MDNIKKRILLVLMLGILLSGCKARQAEAQLPAIETEAAAAAEQTVPEPRLTEAPETKPGEQHFLLTFAGDCTLGGSPFHQYVDYGFLKTVGEDYGHPFRNVLPWFAEDDMTFVNLEGTLTDRGSPVKKKFTFRGPESYSRILTENSVDFVSLANNHTMDYGMAGYENTTRVLQEAGVPYVEQDSSRIVTLDGGLTVGVYGVVYYRIDQQELQQAISQLKQQADVVILAAHWGGEGSYHPSQEQIRLAHAAIDAGADIVWGHHPHVLQHMEKYQDGLICYSLGNFSFGGNIYPEDFDTAFITVDVIRDHRGQVRLGEITAVPCCISSDPSVNNYQPTPYEKDSDGYKRAVSKLDGSWTGPNLKNDP